MGRAEILIVGGGYIGVEFASIFLCFGVQVTLIHRGEHLLREAWRVTRRHYFNNTRPAPDWDALLARHLPAAAEARGGASVSASALRAPDATSGRLGPTASASGCTWL